MLQRIGIRIFRRVKYSRNWEACLKLYCICECLPGGCLSWCSWWYCKLSERITGPFGKINSPSCLPEWAFLFWHLDLLSGMPDFSASHPPDSCQGEEGTSSTVWICFLSDSSCVQTGSYLEEESGAFCLFVCFLNYYYYSFLVLDYSNHLLGTSLFRRGSFCGLS